MNRPKQRKICLILFALILLAICIIAAFALSAQAGCCVREARDYGPCLNIVKLQETLRQIGGSVPAIAGLLALLVFFQLAADAILRKQCDASLVGLKMRLNT